MNLCSFRFWSHTANDSITSEGSKPPYKWYWNSTLGPLQDRPGRPGTWGYTNTDGLGLIEYLQVCFHHCSLKFIFNAETVV